ncbi:FkbM family methyltransferase [Oscillatoria sp. CS-180]|uniref:FkbM family methyltransferase n=1 Tax=Oscillatoria sp. CS-180 TaxID=3021720 RepID=UPI002330CA8F|nr:FkbM family methyltransferase [Oscillatoria sp. CS-180]MDB9524504.1 FkbM family methyltransferase [Oscillatoria sp. CS-180]
MTKAFLIALMRQMSVVPLLPFSVKLSLAQRYRHLRFFLPSGEQFVYDAYLDRFKVNIDTTYPIEVEMATGHYDLTTSAIIRQFVHQKDTVIDVGANVGALTLLMASVASSGRVLAIEPGPSTFTRLKDNLELNPQLKAIVQIFSLGLADKAGELFWQEDPNVPGNAGLLNEGGFRVSVKTLDQFAEEQRLKRLDFVKIDVEGMEYEVICGGLEAIARFRPVLYYETLESFRQHRGFDIYNAIFDQLCQMNYRQFYVLPDGKLSEAKDLTTLKSPNTLAVPAEKCSGRF